MHGYSELSFPFFPSSFSPTVLQWSPGIRRKQTRAVVLNVVGKDSSELGSGIDDNDFRHAKDACPWPHKSLLRYLCRLLRARASNQLE